MICETTTTNSNKNNNNYYHYYLAALKIHFAQSEGARGSFE